MGSSMMCIEEMDVVATKEVIASMAKKIFPKDEDIADVILVQRESLSAFKAKYTFSLKVKHDEILSQQLYALLLDNFAKTHSLYPAKTQTIVENSLLKEIFFIEVIAKA